MKDAIVFKVDGRKIESEEPIYGGETVTVSLAGGTELAAGDYKFAIVSKAKTLLALSGFFAADADGTWTATVNTATEGLRDALIALDAGSTASFTAIVFNPSTVDVILAGVVAVVATPFPADVSTTPTVLDLVTQDEFDAALGTIYTKAEVDGLIADVEVGQIGANYYDKTETDAMLADKASVANLAALAAEVSNDRFQWATYTGESGGDLRVENNRGYYIGGDVSSINVYVPRDADTPWAFRLMIQNGIADPTNLKFVCYYDNGGTEAHVSTTCNWLNPFSGVEAATTTNGGLKSVAMISFELYSAGGTKALVGTQYYRGEPLYALV